jgi:hypothetical protein
MFKLFFIAILIASSLLQAQENEENSPLSIGSQVKLSLNDQFEKLHSVQTDTKTLIFAFSKQSAHMCNDYLSTQKPSYLTQKKALFIADVSAAPSIIRYFFIMPGLKDLKHSVLIFKDEDIAVKYKGSFDEDSVIIVSLKEQKITQITTLQTKKEFIEALKQLT